MELAIALLESDLEESNQMLITQNDDIDVNKLNEHLRNKNQETLNTTTKTDTVMQELEATGDSATDKLEDLLEQNNTTIHLAVRDPAVL